MDFFREVKAKLEEMEKLAQAAQDQAGQQNLKDLFNPKIESQSQVGPQSSKSKLPDAKARANSKRGRADAEQAVADKRRMAQISPAIHGDVEQVSIFDDLGGRLDEAFLLQEVLGPPRCQREWE